MNERKFTPQDTESELRKLTDREAIAYYRICKMSTRCIMSGTDRKLNTLHLTIMQKITQERKLQ